MEEIETLKQEIEKLKEELLILQSQDKKTLNFKFRDSKFKSLAKQQLSKQDYVLVLYLDQKYQAKFMLCRIVSGNIIVINNKVHELDPECIWRYGKDIFYIVREIDRKPVSNKDWNLVKERKDDTDADVPIIKAILGAVQKKDVSEAAKKWIIWIIVAVIVGAVVFSFFR